MLPRPMAHQIRRLHLWARRAVEDWLGGAYHSVFKGAGIAFEEVREYQPGDDVRGIDWHVTARMGTPFIKRYVEERELTVMLLVDVSPSMDFGTAAFTKRHVAIEMAALLALCALYNNDKVGLLAFSEGVDKLIPTRKGPKHALRLLREILVRDGDGLAAVRGGRETNLALALDTLNRVVHRRAIVLVLSDFLGDDFVKPLERAAVRHDLIAVLPRDPWELALPNVGLIEVRDPESGEPLLLDTADPTFRAAYAQRMDDRRTQLRSMTRGGRIDWIDVGTGGGHLDALHRFFESRQRRMGR